MIAPKLFRTVFACLSEALSGQSHESELLTKLVPISIAPEAQC